MKKLTLTFMLLLAAAAAAHAQGTTPAGTTYPPGSSPTYPKFDPDAIRRDETHIANSRIVTSREEHRADRWYGKADTFKAEIEVTNTSAQPIQSVTWTATLLDSETGAVIRTFEVTTEKKVAPGKTKKLGQRLVTPYDYVVRANARHPNRPNVADLKVAVKSVTYSDGTTSTTP